MRTVGIIALLALPSAIIGFFGSSRDEPQTLQGRLLRAAMMSSLIVIASLICVGLDAWRAAIDRRKAREKLLTRPDEDDEAFVARFKPNEAEACLQVRRQIARYLRVDSRKISLDSSLYQLEPGLLGMDFGLRELRQCPDWEIHLLTIGDVVDYVVHRRLYNTVPEPRFGSDDSEDSLSGSATT
jgi:hypothetical protein